MYFCVITFEISEWEENMLNDIFQINMRKADDMSLIVRVIHVNEYWLIEIGTAYQKLVKSSLLFPKNQNNNDMFNNILLQFC